ncbi:hypothetical protein OIU76_021356 [Salix suchowensis]|nr:hypothetical protein OIU76_021356 [Salix suchowensis]KAJ6316743.1 hypothetical protein OIU78_019926 [Salix suchowensis]
MQGLKDTAANIAASAVSGMEKTKATVQEKVEKMTTNDPEQKEMARERKEERITEAELDKQEAKQYRAAESKYGALATGGQGYYGHGTGKQYGGQEEEGVVSTYPGGLPGDSTTRRNTRAGGTAFRTGTDGTGQSYGTDGAEYTTGTDGTKYGTRHPYSGQEEEGMVSTYPGGHPGDSTSGHNTRAGGTAFRSRTDGTGQSYGTDGTEYTTGTDGTGYGTRQPYGGQEEEGVVSTYPGDSTSGRNTRAGSTAFRTGTDSTGYARTDNTGYGTRQPYGRQVEEGVENIYPDGLSGDSTTDHNTRAGGTAFRTGTDGTGYTTRTDDTGYGTRQPYGRQVEGVENIYPDGLSGDSITDHNTRAGGNAFRTGTDDTRYTTGTDDTGYGTRQPYGRQVEEGVEKIYPDGVPGDSVTDHNTRAGDNAFRTGIDGTGYETRQQYGGQVEDGGENIYPDGLPSEYH